MKKDLSGQETTIWTLLKGAKRPLSAYEILGRLQEKGVRSPPTVYRALASLVKRGLVHRLETLQSFMACRHGGPKNGEACGPFAICTCCGEVREVPVGRVFPDAERKAHRFLASIDREVMEWTGICHACSDHQKRGRKCSH